MATAANSSSLDSLINLLGSFKGTSQTSSTQSNVSSEGVNAILQQILGSANGLASVAGGQKSAGLYNSSTNQLLTNDLITRTAGEVAKQQAGSTTTNKTSAKISGGDVLGILALSGAKNLLGPTVSGIAKKSGAGNLGQSLANSLGLGDSTASDALSNVPASSIDPSEFNAMDFVPSGITDALADFGSNLATDTATDVASSVASDAATDVATDSGGDFLSNLFG